MRTSDRTTTDPSPARRRLHGRSGLALLVAVLLAALALPVPAGAATGAPVTRRDVARTDPGVEVGSSVVTNDSDPDGDWFWVSDVATPANGTVVWNSSAVYFTPAAGFAGTETITYTVTDSNGDSSTGELVVWVDSAPGGTAGAPVANADYRVVTLGGSVVFDDAFLLRNDTDPDRQVLSVEAVSDSALGGQVTETAPGEYRLDATSNPSYVDYDDTVYYLVRDPDGRVVQGTLTVRILAAGDTNQPPVTRRDVARTDPGVEVGSSVVTNDSDPDGDWFWVAEVDTPANGTVVWNSSAVYFTPAAGFAGTETITYRVRDAHGLLSTGELVVWVDSAPGGTAGAPVANADYRVVTLGGSVVFDDAFLLRNDTDPDRQVLSVEAVSDSALGGQVTETAPGEYRLDATSNPSYVDYDDTVYYLVRDPDGRVVQGTLTVRILAAGDTNQPPVTRRDVARTDPGVEVGSSVVTNDSDPDGDWFWVAEVDTPANGTVVWNSSAVYFTPAAGFAGTETITYRLRDAHGLLSTGELVVWVDSAPGGTAGAPVANADYRVVTLGGSVVFDDAFLLRNDTDPDRQVLSVEAVSDSALGGQVTETAPGEYRLDATSNPSYVDYDDTVYYLVRDPDGRVVQGTLTVRILAAGDTNQPPVTQPDVLTTLGGQEVGVDVLANDSDPDGDWFWVVGVDTPANGTVVWNSSAVYYTPDITFTGTETLYYTVRDVHGLVSRGVINGTVGPAPDLPPTATSQNVSVTTGQSKVVTLSASDPEGAPLTWNVGAPTGGTVTGTAPNLTYTAPSTPGTYTLDFSVNDGTFDSNTARVTFIVTDPTNRPPSASNDSGTTDEDTALELDPRVNDSDPDGDPLTITTWSGASHGWVTCGVPLAGGGTGCRYEPVANFHGNDSFTYTVDDLRGGTAVGTVSVTVRSVNDVPVAGGDGATTTEDVPVDIAVLANDTDADGDSLTVTASTAPAHGTVTCAPTSCTYRSATNYFGPDAFTYTVSDGNGGSATAQVDVTVFPVNDPPVARPDAVTTDEDTAVTFDPRPNDLDADLDPLTILSATQTLHGSITCSATACTYTPATDYHGADQFTYTVSDGRGGSDTASVDLTVTPVNDAPVADPRAVSVAAGGSVAITLTGSDVEGSPLTFALVASPTVGTLTGTPPDLVFTAPAVAPPSVTFTFTASDGQLTSAPATVTVTIDPDRPPVTVTDVVAVDEDDVVDLDPLANDSDPDGDPLEIVGSSSPTHGTVSCSATTCRYRPVADYAGPDNFTYTVSDGRGGTAIGTVSVTVRPVNDAPVARAIGAPTGASQVLTLVATDVDSSALTFSIDQQPTHGSLGAIGPVTCSTVGGLTTCTATVTWTRTVGDLAADTFSYRASDGASSSSAATVSIPAAVNTAPTAVDDAATVAEDGQVNLVVTANDTDPDGDVLTVTSRTAAAHGGVTCGPTSCTYTPDADFHGSDSFSYSVSDGRGGSDTATVAITVVPVNDVPRGGNDSASTPEDTPVTVDVIVNDTDVDGDALRVVAASAPQHGTVNCGLTSCTYVPDPDFHGQDSFSYTLADPSGATSVAVVELTVTPIDDPPVAEGLVLSSGADQTITLRATDVDSTALTFSLVAPAPAHGALGPLSSPTCGTAPSGTTTCSVTVAWTRTPGDDQGDAFAFAASDGTSSSTATVVIPGSNQLPVPVDDRITVVEDTPYTFDPRVNDSDPEGDPFVIAKDPTPTQQGVVSCTQTACTYTPNPDATGSDVFAYAVVEVPSKGSATAVVSVTIQPVNDPPVAVADTATVAEDGAVTVAVLGNDRDPDGDSLRVTGSTTPSHGSVSCTAASCRYVPAPDFAGSDSFSYTVADPTGSTATATVSVSVTPVNDRPTATSLAATSSPIELRGADVDSPSLTFTVLTAPTHGTLGALPTPACVAGGTGGVTCTAAVTYTRNAGDTAADSFTYRVSDGALSSTIATVSIASSCTITGTAGNDTLTGTAGPDVICAGAGNDTIDGAGGNDIVLAGDGDDRLTGGTGSDRLDGGAGTDAVTFTGATGGITANLTAGTSSGGGLGSDLLMGIENAVGTGFADTLTGTAGPNWLSGAGAGDTISGLAGIDVLDGGLGADDLTGGDGGDFLYGDTVGLTGQDDLGPTGGGNDTLSGGAGEDALYGQAGADELLGGTEDDVLSGQAGADAMNGAGGNDTLIGGPGADGTQAAPISGGSGGDAVFGGDGNDVLDGDSGDDTINGGAGADRIVGGPGKDGVNGNEGADTVFGDVDGVTGEGAGTTSTAFDDRLSGGAGDDAVYGQSGDDVVIGNEGRDSLWGQAGNDQLQGASGADELYGGPGADRLDGGPLPGVNRLDGGTGSDFCSFGPGGTGPQDTRLRCEAP